MRSRSIALLVLLAVALCSAYLDKLQHLRLTILRWSAIPPPTVIPILVSPLLLVEMVGLVFLILTMLVLATSYARTRNAGFLLLGVAVFVWPFVSRLIDGAQHYFLDRMSHRPEGLYNLARADFSFADLLTVVNTLTYLRGVVGLILMLIAVVYLARGDRATA